MAIPQKSQDAQERTPWLRVAVLPQRMGSYVEYLKNYTGRTYPLDSQTKDVRWKQSKRVFLFLFCFKFP